MKTKTKTSTNTRTIKMVELALFVAIIIIMSFTPLGYIKTLGLSITLLVVPVTVGAILLGPSGGAILGAVFGITSFIQCFGLDAFGTMLLSISPLSTFILTIVPRVLMGWFTGLIFVQLRKNSSTNKLSFLLTNLAGPLLNTLLFMPTFVLLFYNTDFIQQQYVQPSGANNVFAFIVAFVGINGLIEAGVCFVLGTAISKTLDVLKSKAII